MPNDITMRDLTNELTITISRHSVRISQHDLSPAIVIARGGIESLASVVSEAANWVRNDDERQARDLSLPKDMVVTTRTTIENIPGACDRTFNHLTTMDHFILQSLGSQKLSAFSHQLRQSYSQLHDAIGEHLTDILREGREETC